MLAAFLLLASLQGSAAEPQKTVCPMRFDNGEAIFGGFASADFLPKLTLHNGESDDAIVKLENLASGDEHMFFVAKGETAVIRAISPGHYTLDFALGGRLAGDCRTLAYAKEIVRFEEDFDLYKRENIQPDGSTNIEVGSNWATLFGREDGKARIRQISISDFNR